LSVCYGKAYLHEMTEADHLRLVETITRCRGVVALSGYANPLYDRALSSWTRHEFNMPNHAGQGDTKERRVEVLWVSRSPVGIEPATSGL
jgi:DNA adenine methylase